MHKHAFKSIFTILAASEKKREEYINKEKLPDLLY